MSSSFFFVFLCYLLEQVIVVVAVGVLRLIAVAVHAFDGGAVERAAILGLQAQWALNLR
jgi:hypothetical protein